MNLLKGFKTENRIETKKVGLVLLIVIVLVCLLGAIPYVVSGVSTSYINALFENVSSFTTTGATTIYNYATVPNSIRLYKSICEWIGGAATLIILATALQSFDNDDNSMGNAASGTTLYRSGIRFSSIIKRLLLTYVVMTALCVLVLWIMGNKPGNCLILAFSCVSTGGFPLYAIDGATEQNVLTLLLVFMVLTSINYTVYYHLIKKHFTRVFNSTELFAFLVMLVAGCAVVVLGLYFSGTYTMQKSVFYGVFESVSYATTTGFGIVSVFDWPAVSRFALMIMSLVGGCTVSIASGLKVMRAVILVKVIASGIIKRIHPASVNVIKFNGKRVSGSAVMASFSYLLIFLAVYIASTFLMSFETGSLEESFIVTNSLITNLGGIYVGAFGIFSKVVMCIVMLLGRLEFYILMLPFAKKEK